MLADVLSTAFLCWDLKKQSRWFNSVDPDSIFWDSDQVLVTQDM